MPSSSNRALHSPLEFAAGVAGLPYLGPLEQQVLCNAKLNAKLNLVIGALPERSAETLSFREASICAGSVGCNRALFVVHEAVTAADGVARRNRT